MSDEPTFKIPASWIKPIIYVAFTILTSSGVTKWLQGDTPTVVAGTRNIADQNAYDLAFALKDIEVLKLKVERLERQ